MKPIIVKDETTTFEGISTQAYGTPSHVALVRSANPHALGGLAVGMSINVPDLPGVTSRDPGSVATDENEVTIKVEGIEFRGWTTFRLVRACTAVDTFMFGGPFEPDNAEFRRVFEPLKYKHCTVYIGGKLEFTGIVVSPLPTYDFESGENSVTASGYALAGVLNTAMMPSSWQTREFNKMTLGDIASEVCRPFGLSVSLPKDTGPVFERVSLDSTANPWPFLAGLTKQRGFVISNDAQGMPVILNPSEDTPTQYLVAGQSPAETFQASFKPDAYFSHITALVPVLVGAGGDETHTVENPHLKGVLRPDNFKATDAFGADARKMAEARAGRMIAGAIEYTAPLAGWRNALGDLWRPNTTLRALGPEVMIYNPSKFLVRRVALTKTGDKDIASLTLALPGVFSGEIPKVLPWQ